MSEEDEKACRHAGKTPQTNPDTGEAECTGNPVPTRGVIQRVKRGDVTTSDGHGQQ